MKRSWIQYLLFFTRYTFFFRHWKWGKKGFQCCFFFFSSYSTNLRWVAILDNTELLSLSYLLIRVMEIISYFKGFYYHGVPLFPLAPAIRIFNYRAKMRECEGFKHNILAFILYPLPQSQRRYLYMYILPNFLVGSYEQGPLLSCYSSLPGIQHLVYT